MSSTGLLPEGALQLVCGGARDLLDHLDRAGHGVVHRFGVDGPPASRPSVVVARSVPFTAEADSLNCSILGPDAAAGTPEFDLYVDQLVTEMTVKAGQKCTAIRRAFVPGAVLDDVQAAVVDRLAQVVVGNPAEPSVQMGPLASLEQREEVRRSLKALLDAGELVYGDPNHVDVVGADGERGAFVSPILIRCNDAEPSRAP